MMRQYLAIKAQHPDSILFYRMGDFYEMFLRDAELAAPLLEIALTTRDRGKPDAVPMCGVPAHAVDAYIQRLAELGHRVAVCEQVEDASRTGGRRLVRREVVEVVTPGLVGDPGGHRPGAGAGAGRAAAGAGLRPGGARRQHRGPARDRGRGAGRTAALPSALAQELLRLEPRELLCPAPLAPPLAEALARLLPDTARTLVEAGSFEPAQAPAFPHGLDPGATGAASRAAAGLLAFLASHQPFALAQVSRLRGYRLSGQHADRRGDARAPRALPQRRGRLAPAHPDRAHRPHRDTARCAPARALARLSAAGSRGDRGAAAGGRLARRARPAARAPARGAALRCGISSARSRRPRARPRRRAISRRCADRWRRCRGWREALASGDEMRSRRQTPARPALLRAPEPLPELARTLREALVDDPPALARGSRGALETGYLREGFHAELDGLREAGRKGREWIAGFEVRERERTGIGSLKIRFHPVHGYGIEISKAQLRLVPADYERKQTLASAERFTVAELRDIEQNVIGAHERAAALERTLFESLRQIGARADARDPRRGRGGRRSRRLPVAGRGRASGRLGAPGGGRQRPALDPRGAASRGRAAAGGAGRRGLRRQRHRALPRRPAAAGADRPEHVRQEHLSAPGGADRAARADRELRPRGGRPGRAWSIASSPGSAPATGSRAASRPSWSRCARRRRSSPTPPDTAW